MHFLQSYHFLFARFAPAPPPPTRPTTSINALPSELLVQIMCAAVEDGADTLGTLMRLCSVCASWRQIATSTPVLWTSFPLPVFRKPSSTRSMSLDITNLALERSYPLPLDVDLRAMALFPGAANVLEYLENTAFRWRSFHMLFYHDELRALSRMSVDTFDSLETLSLQSTAAITWDVPPLDLFLRAPRLRKATLHIDEDIWDESCTVTSRILLPWAQLTHLTLTLNSARMCFDILTRCENLVTATITADNNSGFGADNSHLSAEANLAFLETLSITIEYSGRVDELDEAFAVLRLPALKTLSISRFPALANTTSFRTFLAHAPNIERLDSEFVLEYRHLVAVLPRMRNLTALGLHHFREHYDLLNALRVPMAPETETEAETETLLPRLTSLHLGGIDDRRVLTERTLQDMIVSRRSAQSIARLRTIGWTTTSSSFRRELSEAMRDLVGHGICVHCGKA